MLLALALAALPAFASAKQALPPLPGYAHSSTPAANFPPTAALLGLMDDPLETLGPENEDLRDAVISPPSAAWLMGALRAADPADRLAAVHAAAIPRHVAAIPPLAALMLHLDETSRIRAAAATAIGRIGDAVAAPSLGEALKDPLPDLRYAAALALGRLPAPGAATLLSRALRSDPSWWVRYAAVLALGRTKKGFVVDALEECLRVEPQWQVRLGAVRSLQDIGGPRAAAAVAPALRDKDSGVRVAAALALGKIGGAAERTYLNVALQNETDPAARDAETKAYRLILSKP